MSGERRAYSLVEVLVAAAILAMGAGLIVWNVVSTRHQVARLDLQVIGGFLAQSILEQAVERFHNRDSRYYRLTTPPEEIVRSAAQGRWKARFLALEQPRVALRTGGLYFSGDAAPPWLASIGGDEGRLWDGFSYEVLVRFDLQPEEGDAPVPLDVDRDGRAEKDLARLDVRVYHRPVDGRGAELPVARLTTLVVAPDRSPGVGVLTDF